MRFQHPQRPPTERVALPRVPRKAIEATPHGMEVAEEGQVPARILIVEDDFLIALQTESALTEAGFEVVGTATTAEEAIVLAREQQPLLAVMDIRLASERDGIDTARELYRELNIRCIFATAHDDPRTRQRAEPCAPLGWLTKPYSMPLLLAAVAGALAELD